MDREKERGLERGKVKDGRRTKEIVVGFKNGKRKPWAKECRKTQEPGRINCFSPAASRKNQNK